MTDHTAAALKAKCDERFHVGPSTSHYLSVTGEPYVGIMSGGQADEGEVSPAWCSTPEIACRLWLDAFHTYAKNKRGSLYWRTVPELGERKADLGQFTTETRYAVYARLLISDKPVLAKADA